MQKVLLRKAEKYAKQNQRRRIWHKIMHGMACIVIFCTTYALILPAITMERTQCGLTEHSHSETCYEKLDSESLVSLTCTYESLGVHVHSADCYNSENQLICGQADYLIHAHSADCMDKNGTIICKLPEVSAHEHTDACYRVVEAEPVETETPTTEAPHTHGDECYSLKRGELICQLAETEGHAHGQSCYTQGELICGLSEQEGHTHGEGCSETVQVCELTVEPHVHGDGCYQQMVCEIPEGEDHSHTEECSGAVLNCDITEQPHVHTDGCYQTNYLCSLPETEGHSHGTACYESTLTCELSEEAAHEHTDACYTMVSALTCELKEGEIPTEPPEDNEALEPEKELICTEPAAQVHVHGEDCYAEAAEQEEPLTCTIEVGHVHGATCYDASGKLLCKLPENHSHSAICYGTWKLICTQEEHTHDLVCLNDPEADLETEADWMSTFADVALTGEWDKDLLAIARTQLGYQESTRNYEVLEDGKSINGYTRYGAWYGMPYGDWCAMFVSFCLNYADIPQDAIPYGSYCPNWIEALQKPEYDLYRPAAEYTPVPGDLVFFDWEEDGISDHVGIVTEIIPATEDEPAKLRTIEGNYADQVAEQEYDLFDACIMGYACLPEKRYCGMEQHTHSAECMDEAGNLICALTEHIHNEECLKETIYFCGKEEHSHVSECLGADGNLICGREEHSHTDACLTETVYYCGMKEHAHAENCRDENGELLCALDEHSHDIECTLPLELSEEDRKAVADVIRLIEPLPSYDEIMAKLDEFYEADDTEGEEAYMTEVYTLVEKAYRAYMALEEDLREYVSNEDKLMELEFIWSRITLEFPTYERYPIASAAENTTIHLFDYGEDINVHIAGQGFLPFYRIWPEYAYTVDGEASWDHDTTRPGYIDQYPPILETKLGSNGYPTVNRGADGSFGVGGVSTHVKSGTLQYLFDPDYSAEAYWTKYDWLSGVRQNVNFNSDYTKDADTLAPHFRRAYLPVSNSGDGTGLFQRDSEGYWYYNSAWNAAWYNPSTQKFELYDYTVIPGHEHFEPGNGNFLPFNKGHEEGVIDYQSVEALVHSNGVVKLDNIVSEKPDGVKENFRLKTTDRTNAVNVNFGMTVEFDFYMPKDGKINGKDMIFEFSGDDDVWVYIDDVLVLDIGGCHGREYGSINFASGTVSPPDADAGYYDNYTIKQMYDAANVSTAEFDGATYADFTVHTLKFFYMERGGNVSNCYLRFNMPQVDKNTINVTKALEPDQKVDLLGSPDYYFSVLELKNNVTNKLFIGPSSNGVNSVTGITSYKVKNPDGSYVTDENGEIKIFTVEQYGIFSIKAGQTAVFEGIPENSGNFYVQEMIKAQDYEQYPGFAVNHSTPQWSGVITWDNRTYYPGSGTTGPGGHTWYGVSGPTTNAASDASFIFEQQNRVDTGKLAKLSITKQLNAYSEASAGQRYKINVELDGEPLPEGTTYKVGSQTRTVGFDENGNSYVELAGGETALISNILSGTKFRVWESELSSKGHTVSYTNNSVSGNGENVVVNNSGVSGIVRVNDHVQFTITNTQHGTALSIPVTKRFHSYAGGPYEYTFSLTEMIPGDGNSFTAGNTLQSMSVRFDSSEKTFNFDKLTYLKHEFDTLPTKKYYMIEETGETLPTVDNTMQYLVEVEIYENGNGIAARITNILQRSSADGTWEDEGANQVVFVNTLTGDLTVTKTVKGGSLNVPTTGFEFTLTLDYSQSGTTVESFLATKMDQNGIVTETTITGTSYTFELKHGESITFSGLPIETVWTVTEKDYPAFSETWTVGETSGTGTTSSGTVSVGDTTAAYINNSVYELPETGGTGTRSYTVAGLALILFSAAYLTCIRKRRREVN